MVIPVELGCSKPIPKCLDWAVDEKTYQPTFLGHIALSSGLITLVVIAYCAMLAASSLWLKSWINIPAKLTSEQLEAATARLSSTSTERNRLILQFQDVEDLADKHARIMGFFYQQYYISVAMIGTSASMVLVSLFFISKAGWDKVNNAVINIFIVSTTVFVFYGNISLIFQQRDNLEKSQEIYLRYLNLRNEILSYWATSETPVDGEVPPAKFIHYVDAQAKAIGFIRLGFNPDPVSDLSPQLEDFANPGNPASIP